MGRLYLIMHGDQGRTGKIVLNDGNYDNNAIDNYEFAAPDVGKVKLAIFYYFCSFDSKLTLLKQQ